MVDERKGKGAIGMNGEGVRGARALGSATRRDTIRARERALSPEVLRRVSPRGILGYVRIVQELADNELARSAWCRRGSRFRGVSSFLFFVRRVDPRARARLAASEQASERASEEWCVHVVCVCVLLLAWCARPLCFLSSLPTSPGPFRHTTAVAVTAVTVTAASATLRRLRRPLEPSDRDIRGECTYYHLGVTSGYVRSASCRRATPTHPTRV